MVFRIFTGLYCNPRFQAILVVSAIFLVASAVNLQAPLYITYAELSGYGYGLITVVFAAYVIGLLPILVLFGGISDRIGRKNSILLALILAILATSLMVVLPKIQTLFLTRILQGISFGLCAGATSAYLAELWGNRTRSARYVAATTSVGFGSGALFTSGALLFGQTLIPSSYWIILILTICCTVLFLGIPEQKKLQNTILILAHIPKGTILIGLTITTAWAVSGLIVAVLPAQLAQHDLTNWSGLAIFLVMGIGALAQPIARKMDPLRSIKIGFVLIPSGYLLLLMGSWLGNIVAVLAGAAIAGSACYGFTYLGGMAQFAKAGGVRNARAISGYYIFTYVGFSVPIILIGFISDIAGILNALIYFGISIVISNGILFILLQSQIAKKIQ